jgi:AcrR family transcriptional regulator
VRSHGWSGRTPASDEEAVDRILDAVDDMTARAGATVSISDVARTLGVSRQTVYRYFPNAEALMMASQLRASDGFLDRLTKHLSGWDEPVAAVVEAVAFAVEHLADDSQMAALLNTRLPDGTTFSFTSETALAVGRVMLRRYDVDWAQHGFDNSGIDEIAELAMRTVHSILVDPGQPARAGDGLRQFVARWLGPAILMPQLAKQIDTVLPQPATA